MAFVLKASDSYTWPVVFRQPGNGGKRVKSDFVAEFARLSQTRIAEIQEQAQKRSDGDESQSISDISVADEVLVGWEGIQDENGKDVPFSTKELEEFCEDVDWLKAVLNSYTRTYGEAQAGN